MTTEIRVWHIVDGNLEPIDVSLIQAGRREVDDLEVWIKSHPSILGGGILIIGEQVSTKSGFIDFLGIDESGNLVIIELKRDKLAREVLAQAIDYASDVAIWDEDKIGEVCLRFTGQQIEDYLNENFTDLDLTDLVLKRPREYYLSAFPLKNLYKE